MESMESRDSRETPRGSMPFCPFCFMQQFEITEASQGSVYCDMCGIDIPIKDLVRL
jgi:hypothetical protein